MQSSLMEKSEIEKIKPYLPNIEKLLIDEDIDEIQIAIMGAIDKTLDENNEATSETYELEEIYDKVSERYMQSIKQIDDNKLLAERLKIEIDDPKYIEKKIDTDN